MKHIAATMLFGARVENGETVVECLDCNRVIPEYKALAGKYRPLVRPLVLSLLFIFSLVFSMPAAHATGYTSTPNLYIVDNSPNCVAAASINCFTLLPGAAIQISAGGDGSVYAVNAAHTVYKLNPSTDTAASFWSTSSLPAISQIALRDSANIYALNPAGSCASSDMQVYKANSSLNGWTAINGCANNISVAYDGTVGVVQVSSGGVVFVLKPGASAWQAVPGTGFSKVTVQNQHTAFALKSGGVFKINIDTNTSAQIPWLGASDLSVGPTGVLWMVGLQANINGNGNTYSMDTANNGGTIAYRGTIQQVASGGSDLTFAISGSGLYHFRQFAPAVQLSMSGSYNCADMFPGTGQCPNGSFHTATVHVAFQAGGLHGSSGVSSSVGGNPDTTLNPNASETGSGCDLVFGNPSAPQCLLNSGTARVVCSVMGPIFSDDITPSIFKIHAELARTHVSNAGMVAGSCTPQTASTEWCNYNNAPMQASVCTA